MLDRRIAVALALLPGRERFQVAARLRDRAGPSALLPASLEAVLALAACRRAALDLPALLGEAGRALDRADRAGLHTIPWGAPEYPSLLATIADPPAALWVSGDPGCLQARAVAVVGSRAAAPESRRLARALGAGLAAAGLTVVSGLARGVDGAAHEGALEAGTTVAVLGTGADVVYPREHDLLAARIVSAGGALVSELPPGTSAQPHHFPLRNRIISGLSLGLVVVEASSKSGSLITAETALAQGREVMAVPGPAGAGRHQGAHGLLRDGAALVERAEDVLAVLGLETRAGGAAAGTAVADPLLAVLTARGSADLDELAEALGERAPSILSRLVALEVAGIVGRLDGGRFVALGRGAASPAERRW
jgi:DNA processing protein